MTDPILFAFAVIAILATPGPTNALLATAGAANGLRRSLPLVPAELAGYLIAIAVGGGGQAIASRTVRREGQWRSRRRGRTSPPVYHKSDTLLHRHPSVLS